MSESAALEAWKSPQGSDHDFVIGSSAVEIKTSSGTRDQIRISSEHQLSTSLQHLFLRVFFLAIDADGRNGISLNSLVTQLRSRINDESLSDLFDSRLAEAGYIDIPEYDRPHLTVARATTYSVTEGFPRLTSGDIPAGISDVRYCIDCSSITSFIYHGFPGA